MGVELGDAVITTGLMAMVVVAAGLHELIIMLNPDIRQNKWIVANWIFLIPKIVGYMVV